MEFRILGPVEAIEDDGALPLGAKKQRTLLAALLLRSGQVVSRERLVDALWGDDPPASAVRSLQVYVHGLRRALGADRIETHGQGYRLRSEPAEVDVARFGELVAAARRALDDGDAGSASTGLSTALALWRGPALADLAGEPLAETESARLEDARLAALELWSEAELALGRHETVVPTLESLIAEHPYRERLREQHALALYRSGRQKEALDALRAARSELIATLGVEPGPALRELEQRILRHEADLAAPEPASRTAGDTGLPVPPTPLIGRGLEVAAVTGLLRRDEIRLVTLTGPGGSGKTRLAIAAAEEIGPGLRDGSLFVDLSGVRDASLVAPAIAEALGLRDEGQGLAAVLRTAERSFETLLVLDNFEHLLGAAHVVSDLLAADRHLLVLTTSRTALRLSGEHEYAVPPLDAPDPRVTVIEELARNDAVRLFAARARAVDPSFEIDGSTGPEVAEICRRLDGLPLAIELAAARTKVMTPATIAARLESALELLTRGSRDRPLRHQTLRATLDWSYELLEPSEQRLLDCLSVFAGGFTQEAVDAVAPPDDSGALDLLASLVDHSLLRRLARAGDEPRFGLLETIREYAAERLAGRDDRDDVRARHAAFFLELAETATVHLVASADTLERLETEHDNLRVALARAAATGEVELEVRLAVALRHFWAIRGELGEARRFFYGAIARTRTSGDEALLARALVNGAAFPYRQGDLVRARSDFEEALEIFERRGDVAEVSRCLGELGGVAFSEGNLDEAERSYQRAAAGFRDQGNALRLGLVLANLGAVETSRGDLEASIRYADEAIAIQRELGDRDSLAVSLYNLGRVTWKVGERDRARAHIAESLSIGQALGYREVIAYCLEATVEMSLGSGDGEEPARLHGAARALFAEMGIPIDGDEAEGFERARTELALELGDTRLAELTAAGADAPLDDLVSQAMVLLS